MHHTAKPKYSAARGATVSNRAIFETSRRELSENVSFGTLESRSLRSNRELNIAPGGMVYTVEYGRMCVLPRPVAVLQR